MEYFYAIINVDGEFIGSPGESGYEINNIPVFKEKLDAEHFIKSYYPGGYFKAKRLKIYK